MHKVFVLPAQENWIIDRFVSEWNEDNADISTTNPYYADVIWLLADFCWQKIPIQLLRSKKVLTTIHHIVPEKFTTEHLREFNARDEITTAYHVPNKHTELFVRQITNKPIHVVSYWANDKIWKSTGRQGDIRKKYNLPIGLDLPSDVDYKTYDMSTPWTYLIGSWQRDTEGSDLISPKLEKGPDLLADAIIKYRNRLLSNVVTCTTKLEVVLAGWRRQYLMKRLNDANIKFHYFEKPSQETINELYQTINLYPVTSRYEGGPQSLVECGLLNVPVVSRDIGVASQVLPVSAINDDVTLAIPAIPNVESYKLPHGYKPYRELLNSL